LSEQKDRALGYRFKLIAFGASALLLLFLFRVGYSGLATFAALNAVEAERDQWQRPADVIHALNVQPGNIVADLGCGSGYFALKLGAVVGPTGYVFAEDIRKLPLGFLWFRAAARGEHGVKIILGETDDPHLPKGLNAVLISNTYHEFTNSQAVLGHVYNSLAPNGRLVVVDREPKPNQPKLPEVEHEIVATQVESDLRQEHFEIVNRQDHFIEGDPYGENWWLITARKP
jgi:ubiquinone/menaquinone biosynthesis C-methylase UbiE